MPNNTVHQEPVSKSIFEEYYEFIESLRLNSKGKINSDLLILEKIISLIERKSQDLNSRNHQLQSQGLINSSIENTLTTLLVHLRTVFLHERWFLPDEQDTVKAVAYHLTPLIIILHKLSKGDYQSLLALRYIMKTGKLLQTEGFRERSIDQVKINVAYMLQKLNKNVYKIKDFESFSIDNIEKIDSQLCVCDIDEELEREFEFNEKLYSVVWEFEMKFSSPVYSMAELGYTLWSFAKALESIDGIDVELTYWGEGSKIAQFLVRIKELVTKIDLKDVLKTFRQSIEAYYFNKPYEEIIKIEAETKKLNAEAKKLEKETASIKDGEISKIDFDLSHQERILGILEKRAALEEREFELKKKKIDYYMQTSKLMEDGFVKNNSKIQLMINSILYIDSERRLEGKVENSLDIIEANENYSRKDPKDFIKEQTDNENFEDSKNDRGSEEFDESDEEDDLDK